MISYLDHRQLRHVHQNLQGGLSADESRPVELLQPPAELPPLDCLRIFSNLLGYSPTYDEMLDTYVRNFTGRHVPKSQPVRALTLEVVLSPQQAQSGGHLPIRVPIFDVCPQCEGSGQSGYFLCDQCAGRGMIESFRQVDVLIPSKLKQEMLIPISLQQMGIRRTYLNIRVRPSEVPTV